MNLGKDSPTPYLETEIRHETGLFSLQFGAPAATATHTILYLHGFPGSALEASMLDAAAKDAGVRIVSVDRPGFGKSANGPIAEYSIAAASQAISAVMRDLSILKYSVVAISGGCPYALGVASVAPDEVDSVVVVSGLGELSAPDALTGMVAQNRLMLRAARFAPLLCLPAVRAIASGWRTQPNIMVRYLARLLHGEDREILIDRSFADKFALSVQRGVAEGFRGPYAELRRISRPWALNLDAVVAPVQLFHGDADNYVPLSHAKWIVSVVPHAKLQILPNRGHFMAARMGREILQAVMRAPGAS